MELARALNVSPASVTAMLKRLASAGMVEYQAHRPVRLTPEGQEVARAMVRRHGLLERLLTDVLGVSWEKADDLACQLEHHLTAEVDERLQSFLGEPETCPHGQPIDLEAPDHTRPLADMAVGEEAVLARVTHEATDFLRYLAGMGMRPGARVRMDAQAPFDGPLTVTVDGETHAIGRETASRIRVEPPEGEGS